MKVFEIDVLYNTPWDFNVQCSRINGLNVYTLLSKVRLAPKVQWGFLSRFAGNGRGVVLVFHSVESNTKAL